jgi:hypothetical protein
MNRTVKKALSIPAAAAAAVAPAAAAVIADAQPAAAHWGDGVDRDVHDMSTGPVTVVDNNGNVVFYALTRARWKDNGDAVTSPVDPTVGPIVEELWSGSNGWHPCGTQVRTNQYVPWRDSYGNLHRAGAFEVEWEIFAAGPTNVCKDVGRIYAKEVIGDAVTHDSFIWVTAVPTGDGYYRIKDWSDDDAGGPDY